MKAIAIFFLVIAVGFVGTVEPYPYWLGWYHPHILKQGEKPSYLPFTCWGCNDDDVKRIEKLTGLKDYNHASFLMS